MSKFTGCLAPNGNTLQALSEFVDTLQQLGYPPDTLILNRHTGTIEVYVDRDVELIECGDHVPPDTAYDLLLSVHDHVVELDDE